MNKKIFLWLLAICFSVVLIGCETVKNKVEKTDQWIQDNIW